MTIMTSRLVLKGLVSFCRTRSRTDISLLASQHATAVHIHAKRLANQPSKNQKQHIAAYRIIGYYRRQFSSFVKKPNKLFSFLKGRDGDKGEDCGGSGQAAVLLPALPCEALVMPPTETNRE